MFLCLYAGTSEPGEPGGGGDFKHPNISQGIAFSKLLTPVFASIRIPLHSSVSHAFIPRQALAD